MKDLSELEKKQYLDLNLWLPGDILLHGHTHVPAWQAFGEGNLYLNPGSVSLPKENSPHSYLTLEGGKFLWKELDGTVYHELNI